MGKKAARKNMRNQLNKKPLKLSGENMKECQALKYLGDFIGINLEESAHITVMKRIGVAKKTINDIRTVVEDTRAEKLGAMSLAYELWTQSVMPMVYANCESWISISRKTL